MVPCSRSRMKAAPTRMMVSMVTLLITSMTPPNHTPIRLGLKRTRVVKVIGLALLSRVPVRYSFTSPSAMLLI